MDVEEGLAPHCLTPRDAGAAAALLAGALALYAFTAQERVYGHDGAFLINAFATGLEGHSNSALYATVAGWMGALLGREDPLLPLRWISLLGGAAGVAAVFVLARASGAAPRGALFGALLFALAPAQWFFSTTIETHGLHVGAVGLGALLCVLAPWQRPALARALAVAVFPLLYLTHMTGVLLAPGWPLLARLGELRGGSLEARAPLLPGALWTGLALLPVLAFSAACANHLFGAGFTLFVAEESPTRFLAEFTQRFSLEALCGGWVLALFALLPVAGWTLASGRPRGAARPAFVLLVLPATFVLLWLSIPERGAYFLGSTLFLAALCAHAPLPAGGRGWALAAGLVGLQAVAGRGQLEAFDRMFPLEQRVELVRENLGEEGVLITINPNVPTTRAFLPGAYDFDLSIPLTEYEAAGRPVEQFVADMEANIRQVFPAKRVALDLSHRHVYEEPPVLDAVVRYEPYLIALERHLMEAFETRLVSHPWWPLLVLER